jgi:hypothetical protein
MNVLIAIVAQAASLLYRRLPICGLSIFSRGHLVI